MGRRQERERSRRAWRLLRRRPQRCGQTRGEQRKVEEKKDEGLDVVLDFGGSASNRVGPGVDGIAGAERQRDRRSAGPDAGHGLPLLQQQHKQFRVSNAERIGHSEQLRFSLRGGVLRRKRDGGKLLGGIHRSGLLFDGVGADYGDEMCIRDRSYPYALRCDAGAPGLYYSASVSGCLSVDIDQGSVFVLSLIHI